ncbi:DNA-directed RNA polymerase subunit omega [candidate division TA06 bacterium]|nr:DNA-directed RNA polymerase subunit omega [candidate division TA06 bacterium]
MGFIPIDEISKGLENKYIAVLVAAREARRLHEIRRMSSQEMEIKPITMALERMRDGQVIFQHT